MRTPILAGNWKLHPATLAEAEGLAAAVATGCRGLTGRDVVLAPPFTALAAVARALSGTALGLAAQDLHWESSGAFTGEVSAGMLSDVGCGYVLIGHSERRQFFGETDYTVAKKAAAAAAVGLAPIVCVGETLAQRDAGSTRAVVEKQLRHGLVELATEGMEKLVLAYEPVWAIGTGRTATPEQVQEVHSHLRDVLRDAAPGGIADRVRIVYGGSVKPANVDEIMACADVDGALVGGASLSPDDFLRIVHFEESNS
jgi:triosephosphate isomerase